jgi:exonuclease VII small subunit
MAKSSTIEESFEKLDKIVSQLEDGSLSMNEAFKLYKEGVQLVNNCNNMLDKVEKQLVVLNGSEETDDV